MQCRDVQSSSTTEDDRMSNICRATRRKWHHASRGGGGGKAGCISNSLGSEAVMVMEIIVLLSFRNCLASVAVPEEPCTRWQIVRKCAREYDPIRLMHLAVTPKGQADHVPHIVIA
jgi:hypothetical protein